MKQRLARLGVGALLGLLSAGLAVGIGEATAVFVRPAAAPIIVVGNRIILLTPEPVRRWAIRQFGTSDKPALLMGIYLAIGVFAVVVGILALRRLWFGLVGIAAFGAFAGYCALTSNAHRTSDVLPSLIATVAGLLAMVVLARSVLGERESLWASAEGSGSSSSGSSRVVADRRRFLQGGLVSFGVALLAGFGGRQALVKRYDVSRARAVVVLPTPTSLAPALANGTDLGKSGVPFITANTNFYRVDTALSVPQLDPAGWGLSIHGMVDQPVHLTYAELLAQPQIERWITLACVSNEVGGTLVGNARFLGARLAPLLRLAGVHRSADQLVCRSSDGMSIGTPVAVVMDGRDAMLAVAMNGEPLPLEHGFPVRMVVPGLYGYVSACKWIVDIEVTTFSAYDAYWVQQGWIAQAPIVTAARIDTPKSGGSVPVGQSTVIAGVAWEQGVGISKVEVQVDNQAWMPARLAPVPSIDTWQQWVSTWTPTQTGAHTIRVRATDRNGQLQTATGAEPYPGAATGWHTINVNARA